MTTVLLTDITIFVLALLVGFEVISKVPATLHTPLMSAANSIHGIVLAGAMLIAVTAHDALGLHPGLHRLRVRGDERGRRLRGHRPDAQDVPPVAHPGAGGRHRGRGQRQRAGPRRHGQRGGRA